MPSSHSAQAGKEYRKAATGVYVGDGVVHTDPLPVPDGTPLRANFYYKQDAHSSEVQYSDLVFPDIGSARVPFYGLAGRVLRWLDESGEATRLMNMPQLGSIAHGAHEFKHSRWEYACLICYLASLLRGHSKQYRLGLTARTTLTTSAGKSVEVSGVELLQAWSLLTNAGHLKETFAVESVFRDMLLEKPGRVSLFARLFRTNWAGRLVREIITRESDYHFYIATALLNLEQLHKRDRRYQPFATVLAAYARPNGFGPLCGSWPRPVAYLVHTYKVLRMLAFVALDSHYSRHSVKLSLPHVVSELPAFFGDTHSDESQLKRDLLKRLADYYSSTCYCSPATILLIHAHKDKLRKHVARAVADLGNKRRTLDRIRNWKTSGFGFTASLEGWRHVCRFHLPADEAEQKLSTCLFERREGPGREHSAAVLLSNAGGMGARYLDVFCCSPDPGHTDHLCVVGRLGCCQMLAHVNRQLPRYGDDEQQNAVVYQQRDRAMRRYSNSIREYLRAVLLQLGRTGMRVDFKDSHCASCNRWYYGHTRDGVLKDLNYFRKEREQDFERCFDKTERAVRMQELDFLEYVFRRSHPRERHALLFTGSVQLYHPEYGDLTDIDGVALFHSMRNVHLVLLQSKETHSGSVSQAQKWVRATLAGNCLPNAKGRYKVNRYKNRGVAVSIQL